MKRKSEETGDNVERKKKKVEKIRSEKSTNNQQRRGLAEITNTKKKESTKKPESAETDSKDFKIRSNRSRVIKINPKYI